MPPLPPPEDDSYDSAADSDFNASLSPSSGEESEERESGAQNKKAKKDGDGDLEMGSGDEGVVAQGRKKKRRKGAKSKKKGKAGEDGPDGQDEDMEESGEDEAGIRVRLRSGRGGEETRRKALPKSSAATVNIEELWARMNDPSSQQQQPPPLPPSPPRPTAAVASAPTIQSDKSEPQNPLIPSTNPSTLAQPPSSSSLLHEPEQTIQIPHIYTFAGQTHTSSKTVPISSPAAQAYLATQKDTTGKTPLNPAPASAAEIATSTQGPPLRRPLARKNLLQPNPTCYLTSQSKTLPPRPDLPSSMGGSSGRTPLSPIPVPAAVNTAPLAPSSSATTTAKSNKADRGEKLNTVEKSKLDWEAEVDRLGLREELARAEKSGSSYLGRREFLDRVESARDEVGRRARLGLGLNASG